uniref:Predicted oxidoreductase n=1 Tax=Candidatus Kentrum sp. FW TaxID=2126338 RepID=A0A450TI05_9GAMM|nr:MAG: Predicted oxidoreductase [Candidatus Kentron sp. FW]
MKYKNFGETGLRVSELSLGTMTFGESWGFGVGEGESKKIFSSYIDLGGNFIDTANVYTDGESEKMLGRFLSEVERDRLVVSTKYSLLTDSENINALGNGRKCLTNSINRSLKQLGIEYIDIYWVHAWYGDTNIQELLISMDALVRSGKVLYWGFSDTPSWVVSEARALSKILGLSAPSAFQFEYSLVERTVETEIIPFCATHNVPMTTWAPLSGGLLTGKHHLGTEPDTKRAARAKLRSTEKNNSIVNKLLELASGLGCSPEALALRWVLSRNDQIFPIIGARSSAQLLDNIASLDQQVTQNALNELTTISEPYGMFPASFLSAERTRQVMFGKYSI